MRLWSFIACFSLTCYLVSGQNEKYVLVGETVDFAGFSDIKESPADILWKHIGGHIVHKVVHFDSSQEHFFGSYEGRVTLSWSSADLSISNLRYEDSGTYDLEISINNQFMTKRYQLKVIEKVTKPTISCEINNASTAESAGNATLLCSLPSHFDQSSLKFQWSTNGKIDLGHMLKISLGGEFDDRQYSCSVNNPLTQDSAVFIAKKCYPETKAQAGLIAGVVVAVILLLIILLMVFFYLKKVRSNHQKSVAQTQSNSGFPKVETSGSEETQGLLNKTPPSSSKHSHGHLNQRNDTPLDPSHKDSEKNKVQDIKIPFSPPVKELCNFFEQENEKANESEPREVVEEEVLDDNPSDSEPMNPELITLSPESNSEKNKVQDIKIPFSPPVKELCNFFEQENEKANESEPREVDVLENNPSDSEPMNPELITLSPESNPEKIKDEDNKASHQPPVAKKPNLDQIYFALQKAAENTNPKVIKQQGLDDPADSGNPIEVSSDQNSGSKKEENEFAKSTPENDVQPPPVAKENSPLSQNSPESSPKAEQDINSDECAMTSSGKSSSSFLEKSEDGEQVPPASTPKKD